MTRYKVTMVCKEISRAETIIECDPQGYVIGGLEGVKDRAWVKFDRECSKDLEQENYTKVEEIS